MGKSKRKINKLKRQMAKKTIKPRIPIAPPGIKMKSKKDYNRSDNKKIVEREFDG